MKKDNKKEGIEKEEFSGENEKKLPKKTKKKINIETVLIENFIHLQRVLTNLASRFDELSKNIEKLLRLFEITAESYAGKDQNEVDREFLKKLDSLLDQNKVISKGIMLMEEKIRNKSMPQNQEFNRALRPSIPKY